MRIVSPSGVLNNGNPELSGRWFEKEASIKRVVNYQKENMDLCIFYDVENKIDPENISLRFSVRGRDCNHYFCIEISQIHCF